MTKVDLITGFLGTGKTTFIKQYASFLAEQGYKVGIIENDFGAVNVDMMLLQEELKDRCDLEMISGGCDQATHQRRFKTKLIAMGMLKYDYLLIEPSGIYDVDEFFDVLHEEPLAQWYEIGNVFAVVDATMNFDLSKSSRYILASQIAHAGSLLLSHYQEATPEQIQQTKAFLQKALQDVQCSRILQETDFFTDWQHFTKEAFLKLMNAGYVLHDYVKHSLSYQEAYTSLYFMNNHLTQESLKICIARIFDDPSCGHIFRIKGFLYENDQWFEINATKQNISLQPISIGQDIIIAIGENLNKEQIQIYFNKKTS